MVFVFRYSQVDSSAILAVAASLVRKTRYCKEARRELAPDYTDCITAIHYIFKQAMIDIPLTYIGDMPRELSLYGEWRQLVIPREDVQCGEGQQ